MVAKRASLNELEPVLRSVSIGNPKPQRLTEKNILSFGCHCMVHIQGLQELGIVCASHKGVFTTKKRATSQSLKPLVSINSVSDILALPGMPGCYSGGTMMTSSYPTTA